VKDRNLGSALEIVFRKLLWKRSATNSSEVTKSPNLRF